MKKTAGVIIGRFQIFDLIDGYREVFNKVLENMFDANMCMICIPPSAIKATKANPLDFDSRRRMIDAAYPYKFEFNYIKDCRTDLEWSQNLDRLIEQKYPADIYDVVLFGTKEGFTKHYIGKNNVSVFESSRILSEDVIRTEAGKKSFSSLEWRAGAIWATQHKYNSVLPTVDCAIFDDDTMEYCWMARKSGETGFRFVGGFSDPLADSSYEETAVREALEETRMECEVKSYVCSMKIDDWRFKAENDKIITTLFAMVRKNGVPSASDDICELHKVPIMSLAEENVQPEHVPLLRKLKRWLSDMK